MITPSQTRTGPFDADDPLAHYPWPEGRWVRASMVSTADGAGAGPDGTSASISTPADFALFRALRNNCDVIVVGAGTARAEGYRPPASARLAVVTRSGRLDPILPFIADARPDALPLVLTCGSAEPESLADLHRIAEVVLCGDTAVDLTVALSELEARGLRRVVVEGGPSLLADLAAADLVDEYDLQLTPFLAGGSYASGSPTSRILSRSPLTIAPAPLTLAHVLTDGQTVFLRYLRAVAADGVSATTRAATLRDE